MRMHDSDRRAPEKGTSKTERDSRLSWGRCAHAWRWGPRGCHQTSALAGTSLTTASESAVSQPRHGITKVVTSGRIAQILLQTSLDTWSMGRRRRMWPQWEGWCDHKEEEDVSTMRMMWTQEGGCEHKEEEDVSTMRRRRMWAQWGWCEHMEEEDVNTMTRMWGQEEEVDVSTMTRNGWCENTRRRMWAQWGWCEHKEDVSMMRRMWTQGVGCAQRLKLWEHL